MTGPIAEVTPLSQQITFILSHSFLLPKPLYIVLVVFFLETHNRMLMRNRVRSDRSVSLSKGRGKKCLSINHWAPSPNTCLSPFLYLVVSGKSNQPRRKRILTRPSSVWFIKAVFTVRHALTEALNLTCYINIKSVFFNTLNYGFMKTKNVSSKYF